METIDGAARRKRNDGYRKLDLEDRVLLFLCRLYRKRKFKELGYEFGCGRDTARRYFREILDLFCQHLVPQLVFLRSPDELRQMMRPAVKEAFPDLLAILDATNWEQQKSENFLLNRLSYSAYKHFESFQSLFGKRQR